MEEHHVFFHNVEGGKKHIFPQILNVEDKKHSAQVKCERISNNLFVEYLIQSLYFIVYDRGFAGARIWHQYPSTK